MPSLAAVTQAQRHIPFGFVKINATLTSSRISALYQVFVVTWNLYGVQKNKL